MMVISQNEVRILYIGKQWAVGEYNGTYAWFYYPDRGALRNDIKYTSSQVRPLLASKRV